MKLKDFLKSVKNRKDKNQEPTLITTKEMLQEIMRKRDLEQQELANLLEVDKAQISRWLNGATPKIENQRKIKKIYDEVKIETNK